MASPQDLFQRAVSARAVSDPKIGRMQGLAEVALRMQVWNRNILNAMKSGLREWAEKVESQMQANARWNDRTGHARGALRAYLVGDDPRVPDYATIPPPAIQPAHEGDLVVVATGLMHYNSILEFRDGGKYAIMWPTMVENNASVVSILVAHGKRAT